MEPEIISRPAFTVAGIKYRGQNANDEIAALWNQEFFARMDGLEGRVNEQIFYGAMGNYDVSTGEFDYIAGVEVKSAENLPPDLAAWEVPARSYAVFSCTLPELKGTFDIAFSKWLPGSDYNYAGDPTFEYYDQSFMDGQKMYVYLPVVKK